MSPVYEKERRKKVKVGDCRHCNHEKTGLEDGHCRYCGITSQNWESAEENFFSYWPHEFLEEEEEVK